MWDSELVFSSSQTVADTQSENIVDTGGPEIGMGGSVVLEVNLGSGCGGELAVSIDTSASPSMADAVRVAQYIVEAGRVATGGTVLAAPLPTGLKRYLRLTYAGATGGTVTAGLTMGAQTSGLV